MIKWITENRDVDFNIRRKIFDQELPHIFSLSLYLLQFRDGKENLIRRISFQNRLPQSKLSDRLKAFSSVRKKQIFSNPLIKLIYPGTGKRTTSTSTSLPNHFHLKIVDQGFERIS